jgi:hypothetical protein
MIFSCAVAINWDNKHQQLVTASNQKENKSCLEKHYSPGDKVLIVLGPSERHSQAKMNTLTRGAYTITKIYNMEPSKSITEI